MRKDKILENIPELDYIRRWTESMDRKQYKEAISILEEGLKFAKERGSVQFVRHFQSLKQTTKTRFIQGKEAKISCSFCGKKQDAVTKMVAGANAFICEECIKLCLQIIAQKPTPSSHKKKLTSDTKEI